MCVFVKKRTSVTYVFKARFLSKSELNFFECYLKKSMLAKAKLMINIIKKNFTVAFIVELSGTGGIHNFSMVFGGIL